MIQETCPTSLTDDTPLDWLHFYERGKRFNLNPTPIYTDGLYRKHHPKHLVTKETT